MPADPVEPPSAAPSSKKGHVVLFVAIGAVLAAALFAAIAVHVARDRQHTELRASGLPSAVSTRTATLMELSAVPAQLAPDVTLTDQDGRRLSMSSLRGHVVVLEFMDPHCTDICPIISQEFVDANHDLGAGKDKVVFAAINVNRFARTVADARHYSSEHGLDSIASWHFLTGSTAALRAAWHDYGVYVHAPSPTADVIHSSFVYFIDPSGHERYLGAPTEDHTASGTAYLPVGQMASWGAGIAAVARSLEH